MHPLTVVLFATTSLVAAAAAPGRTYSLTATTTPMHKRTAQEVIAKLNLIPNVEKGYFVETFRDVENVTLTHTGTQTRPHTNGTEGNKGGVGRSASTAIYYLLEGSVGFSNWHRVDAVEMWHYYAGAPLVLSLAASLAVGDNSLVQVRNVTLGPDIFAEPQQVPQVKIAKWEWQRAKSLGDWTLVGTTGVFSLSLPFRPRTTRTRTRTRTR